MDNLSTIQKETHATAAQHDPQLVRFNLLKAVQSGDTQEVERLLKTPDLAGLLAMQHNTLLHIAASKGYEPICRLLLEKGHTTNPANDDGKTPYQCASSESIKCLLAQYHKKAVCARFYTHGTEDQVTLKKYAQIRSELDSRNENKSITPISLTIGNHFTTEPHLSSMPPITTEIRESLFMIPYYGELIVILENKEVNALTSLFNSFIQKKFSMDKRCETVKASLPFSHTKALLHTISEGFNTFPFLREMPHVNDKPHIAQAKKLFWVLIAYKFLCDLAQHNETNRNRIIDFDENTVRFINSTCQKYNNIIQAMTEEIDSFVKEQD